MQLVIEKDADSLGRAAADLIARRMNEAIAQNGEARMILSTGASQFETLAALVREPVDWEKVTIFHLDEYVGLPETHPASFRRYLRERVLSKVPVGQAYLVDGEGDVEKNLRELTEKLCEKPIDVGVIGIGENAHIAFNDPPADFETKESFRIVHLDDRCRHQQLREGWFPDLDAVPRVAVSMTPYRIMQCGCIVSSVPHSEKAEAVYRTLSAEKTTNLIPATLLRAHGDWHLFLDQDSASLCGEDVLAQYR